MIISGWLGSRDIGLLLLELESEGALDYALDYAKGLVINYGEGGGYKTGKLRVRNLVRLKTG